MSFRKIAYIASGALVVLAVVLLVVLLKTPDDPTDLSSDGDDWLPGDSMILYENLPLCNYDDEAFAQVGNFVTYTGSDAVCSTGIDVSNHNGEIDWQAVAEDGIDFAMISVGYRGYTKGTITLDNSFVKNIEGALAAGLKVGVYFFSQAVSMSEAIEEAEFVLEALEGFDMSLPVVYDWETVNSEDGRTHGMNRATVTNCAIAFCSAIEDAGYIPMVYFNKSIAAHYYDLGRLGAYDFWLASYASVPGFIYDFQMWQYSDEGRVAGISGEVDLNLCFKDYTASQPDSDINQ